MGTQPYNDVDEAMITFGPNSRTPEAQKCVNSSCSEVLANPERSFIDELNWTDLKDEADLKNEIQTQIVDWIEMQAIHTVDESVIPPIIQAATLQVKVGNACPVRLVRNKLEKAFEKAIQEDKDQIEIVVGTNHIAFDDAERTNFLDWSCVSTTVPPKMPEKVEPTTAELAAIFARNTPKPMTANELVTALQSHGAIGTTTATSNTQTGSSASQNQSTLFTFNSRALPPDVQNRHDKKKDGHDTLGSMVRTPCANGNFHHLEGTDKIVLSDGTVFIIQDTLCEKGHLECTCPCEDNTHAGVRAWCNEFVQISHDCGCHMHPLWSFRKDHGGPRGFTAGDSADDDLPLRMSISLDRMMSTVQRVLARKDMFPTNSRLRKLVQGSDGDGCELMKQILFKSHPTFRDQPSTLIERYPAQRHRSLQLCHDLFVDCQQLRAFIMDVDNTLDDPFELDVFISNAEHSVFLNRVTQDERRLSSHACKHRKDQIIETLETFLMSPDSPAVLQDMVSKNKCKKPDANKQVTDRFKGSLRKGRPIKAIETDCENLEDADNGSETDNSEVPDASDEDFVLTVNQIEVSEDAASQAALEDYRRLVQRIEADRTQACNKPCVVCGKPHRFADCDVLKNVDFLKAHYIRHCSALRRETDARAKEFSGVAAKLPSHVKLNCIDAFETGENSETDDDEDFQTGRV